MNNKITENITRVYNIGNSEDRSKIYAYARNDLTKTINELNRDPSIEVLHARWYYHEGGHGTERYMYYSNEWTLIPIGLTMYEVTDVRPTAIKWFILIERTINND